MTHENPWIIPLLASIALLVLLAACQTMAELPACTSNCTVVVVDSPQDRGGNSPSGSATVPVSALP